MNQIQWESSWWIPVAGAVALVLIFYFLRGELKATEFQTTEFRTTGAPRLWRVLLMGLALATALLAAVQLNAPVWVKGERVFHSPRVVLAVDRSSSFMGGEVLGVASRADSLAAALEEVYGSRGFETHVVHFDEKVYRTEPDSGESLPALTRLFPLWDYLKDSLGFPPPAGMFLLSDGRVQGEGIRQRQTTTPSDLPVFPLVLEPRRFTDLQLDSLAIEKADGKPELQVQWTRFGEAPDAVTLVLGNDQKTLREVRLKADPARARQSHSVDLSQGKDRPTRGFITTTATQFTTDNDTVVIRENEVDTLPEITVLKSIHTLDGRWLIRSLEALGYPVNRVDAAALNAGVLNAGNLNSNSNIRQLWLPATHYKNPEVQRLLESRGDLPVLVFDAGGSPNAFPDPVDWKKTAPHEPLRLAPHLASYLPGVGGRLKNYTVHSSLRLPSAKKSKAWLEAGDACLVCSHPGRENTVYFFLEGYWQKLFSPSESFEDRERLLGLLDGLARRLGDMATRFRVRVPRLLIEDVPFELVLLSQDEPVSPVLKIAENTFQGETNTLGEDLHLTVYKPMTLKAGTYPAQIEWDHETVWKDTLEVKSKWKVERSRLGYDRDRLQRLAAKTGGNLLSGDSLLAGMAWPALPEGQLSQDKTSAVALYNNWWTFALAILLMAVFWGLRKWRGLD